MDACSIALGTWVANVAEWRSLKATFARSGQLESSLNKVSKLIREDGAERLREVSCSQQCEIRVHSHSGKGHASSANGSNLPWSTLSVPYTYTSRTLGHQNRLRLGLAVTHLALCIMKLLNVL